jgi:ArsR family transcriptional regulator
MLLKAYNVEEEELALKLKALGHVSRLKILATLTESEKYLSRIAEEVGISRALAKVHLKKLREAGLVETRVVLLEDEARALRFYKLKDFHIELSPEKLKRRKEMNGL